MYCCTRVRRNKSRFIYYCRAKENFRYFAIVLPGHYFVNQAVFDNMFIIKIILLLLFIYLAAGTLYLLVLAVAGRFGKLPVFGTNPEKNKIAVIIPSYKEDHIIVDTAIQARKHNYPPNRFDVLVAADKLQAATIEKLRSIPVQVLELDVSMKAKSVHAALNFLDNKAYDIAVILDADNVMGAGCLEKINDAFQKGYKALQCHRTAKNQHTPVALLDGISEEININLFRRGPAVLHISAAPVGSGMAFEFNLLKEIFSTDHILNNPGEDREIDLHLMKKNIPMQFIDGAYVYDEKVASAAVFEKQRVRWLEAQLNHLRRFSDADLKNVVRNKIYYNKFYQNLLLPRLFYIMIYGLFFFLAMASIMFNWHFLTPGAGWWLGIISLYIIVLLLSVPGKFYTINTLKAIAKIPSLMLSMIKALLRIKKGRKEFLHTPKTFTNE